MALIQLIVLFSFVFVFFAVCLAPDNVEYVLSSPEDGMVAYRIVEMSDDETKPAHAHANNNATTIATMPQQLQYIVIDNGNGYLQAVPATTPITSSTTASISISNNSSTSSVSMPVSTSRPSITIAPKTIKTDTNKYGNAVPLTSTKQSVRIIRSIRFSTFDRKYIYFRIRFMHYFANLLTQINVAANKAISVFKKRDDRRRATHNEVESKYIYMVIIKGVRLHFILPGCTRFSYLAPSLSLAISIVPDHRQEGEGIK